jgi:hypothetical protein
MSNEKKNPLIRLEDLTPKQKKKLNQKVQESFHTDGFPNSLAEHTQRYLDVAEKLKLIPPIQ